MDDIGGIFVVVLGAVGISCAVLVVGAAIAIPIEFANEKKVEEQKQELETQLAQDANLKNFNLKYCEMTNVNDDYFFVFTGDAIKLDGQPIDFVLTKYQVSEEHYLSLANHLKTTGFKPETFKSKKGVFDKILGIVCESELVRNSSVEKTNAISGEDSTNIVLRSVQVPVIHEDKGVATYEVELIKYDADETNNPKMELITKQVVVKLTDEMIKEPTLAYLADEKDCKVKVISREVDVMTGFKYKKFTASESR